MSFLQPLDKSFVGVTALVNNVITTLTFKNASGEASVLAKRIGIKTVLDKVAGFTGVVYYKTFANRATIDPADNVTSGAVTCLTMGENVVIPGYVSRIQFLSVDPGAIGISVSVEAQSDADISGSTFA